MALIHLAALAALVRMFAPQLTAAAIETASSLITVQIVAPAEPAPSPEPASTADAGEEGQEAPRETPREAEVPPPPLQRASPAPVASGTSDRSGGGVQGQGTGAGDEGTGTGSGLAGSGQGSGARPLQLISGTIDDARDYPTPPGGRQVRRGHDVVIELTVNQSGRVSACRVTDPSPDPEADALTCRLATERFVFLPRLDASGQPVVGIYRWRQRWF